MSRKHHIRTSDVTGFELTDADYRAVVSDYLAAHPSLVDLSSPEAEMGLTFALADVSWEGAPPEIEARAIITAWLATLRAEGSR